MMPRSFSGKVLSSFIYSSVRSSSYQRIVVLLVCTYHVCRNEDFVVCISIVVERVLVISEFHHKLDALLLFRAQVLFSVRGWLKGV